MRPILETSVYAITADPGFKVCKVYKSLQATFKPKDSKWDGSKQVVLNSICMQGLFKKKKKSY